MRPTAPNGTPIPTEAEVEAFADHIHQTLPLGDDALTYIKGFLRYTAEFFASADIAEEHAVWAFRKEFQAARQKVLRMRAHEQLGPRPANDDQKAIR